MNTGTFVTTIRTRLTSLKRLSLLKRYGIMTLGVSVLATGLFLGGCNGKLKQENETLRDQNAEFKDKLTSTETEKAALATQLQQTTTEKDQLARDLAARQAQAQFVNNTPPMDYNNGRNMPQHEPAAKRTITLSGDTLFASGSTTLKATAKKSIDQILPEIKSASNIRVEGYTDSDPIKHANQFKTNQALSKARADAVTTYLVSKGISKSKITAVGMGAKDPKSTKAESRRVEIVVAE